MPIIHDMAEKEYHSNTFKAPMFSASIAKVLWQQTPFHAYLKHPALNPAHENEQKACFDFGHALHALILENNQEGIKVIDHGDWRTNAAKDAKKQAYADGMIPLLTKDFERAHAMKQAAHAYLEKSELGGLPTGNAEVTIVEEIESGYQDKKIMAKSRLDFLSEDRKIIMDYKSTKTSAAPDEFARQITKMGYDIQGEMYKEMNIKSGGPKAKVVFFVQEDKEPYLCSLIGMAPTMIELGKAKLQHAKALWANCLANNEWPGYPTRIAYAEAPPWEINKIEETIIDREMEQL